MKTARLIAPPLAALAVVAAAAAPAAATAPTNGGSAVPTAAVQRVQKTTITLNVATCGHCPVRLTQARAGQQTWQSATKRVRNGSVSFVVPTRRTHGMTVSVGGGGRDRSDPRRGRLCQPV